VWKVIILIHILLGINLSNGSWTLENILFEFVRIFSLRNLINLFNQNWLIQTSKSHLVLHWNWNFTVFDRLMFFLFWNILRTSLFLRMIWVTRIRRNWWHRDWRNSMWSMNHASSNTLLMRVVRSLLWRLSILSHVLKVKEAAMSISMGLGLHHFKCLFVLVALSVKWTSPYHHLLILMMSLTLHVLLVLHILIMIILLFLMCDHLHVLVKFQVLLVRKTFLLLILNLILTIDHMRFDREIFLLCNFGLWFNR